MKLAEALSLRAQLNTKISQLRSRLNDCIKVQEGDEPAETAEAVVAELDEALAEFSHLVYRINMTNAMTLTDDGRNLTALLADRDALSLRVKALGDALQALTEKETRYSRSEIKFVRTVDVASFRQLYDQSAAELRQLDLRIQALGFVTDLGDITIEIPDGKKIGE